VASPERYKHEYQQETIGQGPDGRPVEGVKVGFVHVPTGTHFSVFVPKLRFNADTVKALADERAAHIESVHKLSG